MNEIKLYLLTGYLGAGKTTFLKQLITDHPDKKIGIIMNEFGKVGIDGSLIEDGANELIELNRGSIFCSCLKLSFVESLKDMSDKPIDILFVEGSGLADPSNIGEILDATKMLIGDRYTYSGSICLVDARNFSEASQEHQTLEKQLIHSHLAVVSKTDLTDNFDQVQEAILSFNPNIDVTQADFGKIDFNLFDNWDKTIEVIQDETSNSVENKPKTLSLEMFEPVNLNKLKVFLSEISKDAYRIKGFITTDDNLKMQVDVVNGVIDLVETPLNKDNEIVIISKIGPMIIRQIIPLWEAHLGTKFKLKN